jgi:hypothetical protein
MTTTGKNRIMIYGPKEDGTYGVEFKTAAGEAMAISIPRNEAAVIRHFQERMPYGLCVPEVGAAAATASTASTGERSLAVFLRNCLYHRVRDRGC